MNLRYFQSETRFIRAMTPRTRNDEDRAGEINAANQLAEGTQGADAIFPDGEGHGPERGQRRQIHDETHDAEQAVQNGVNHIHDHFSPVGKLRQRQTEQDRNQNDLQHVALGQRRPRRWTE